MELESTFRSPTTASEGRRTEGRDAMHTNIITAGLTILLGVAASARHAPAQEGQPKADKFAQIAAIQADYGRRDLISIAPEPLVRRLLPLDGNAAAAAFQPGPKMTTAEQVSAELLRQRELHAPYLKDLAPPLADTRLRVPLDSFDWRIETEQDRADFSGTLAGQGQWQQVKIPHYAGPMGRAVTYYRTAFDVTPAMLEKGAMFVRFQGVDYKAHVFVNGALLGSHEGIFAPFEFEFTRHAAGELPLLRPPRPRDPGFAASGWQGQGVGPDGILRCDYEG